MKDLLETGQSSTSLASSDLPRILDLKGGRMAALDALRGIASLGVIFPHSIGLFSVLGLESLSYRIMQVMKDIGISGIDVFFVLSGFVIALTGTRHPMVWKNTYQFMARRMARLAPPYWAAIGWVLLVLGLQSTLGKAEVFPSVKVILANVFYLQEVLQYRPINVVFWTLCLEVQFYLLFTLGTALVINLTPPGKFRKGLADGGLLLGWAISFWVQYRFAGNESIKATFLMFWNEFALGILAWRVLSRTDNQGAWIGWIAGVLTLAIGLAQTNIHHICAGMTFCFIVSLGEFGRLRNSLNWNGLRFLGKISYSLYLTHVPVLLMVLAVRARLPHDQPIWSWVFLMFGILASILFAWGFHHAIEKPSIRWSHRFRT